MPIQAYIKTAASNLRQAAQTLDRDISNMRQQIAQEDRQHQDMVILLRQRRRDSENDVTRIEDQSVKQQKIQEIAVVKQQEIGTEQERDQIKRQLSESVTNMQNVMDDLNRYASELEKFAARVR